MPGNSIAATIANEFAEADSEMYRSSLIALGFVLFLRHLRRAGDRAADADAARRAGGQLMSPPSPTRLYRRRRVKNVRRAWCWPAPPTIFGLFWLVWILWTTLSKGMAAHQPRRCSPR